MVAVNNKAEFRFEIKLDDGEFAILTYRWLKGSMVLMHTVVPRSAEGKGVGSALAKFALEHARTHHLKIIVYCTFVRSYMERHPEYNDLLDDQHKG